MRKVAILGASRGLGQALAEEIHEQFSACEFLLISRTEPAVLKTLSASWVRRDLAKPAEQAGLFEDLELFQPTQILYTAGGGPHGKFAEKDIKSHLWATEVNYLAVLRLLHWALNARPRISSVQQFAVVGSAIAGHTPDPLAASYSAAKHALRGLVGSVAHESPWFDVKLYEPGYMDTSLLPANAWPRAKGLAVDPRDEAKRMLLFLQTPNWLGGPQHG